MLECQTNRSEYIFFMASFDYFFRIKLNLDFAKSTISLKQFDASLWFVLFYNKIQNTKYKIQNTKYKIQNTNTNTNTNTNKKNIKKKKKKH